MNLHKNIKAFTLAEGATHVDRQFGIRMVAFTLAEVLITLGIIGIVAALTIPTLIENTKRQETTTALKKFYSTMNQAIRLSEIDNGTSLQWTFPDGDTRTSALSFFNTYLAPYFKYSKIDESNNTIYLNDGSTLSILKGSCMDMHFDTNGNKKPNMEGRDAFRFFFCLPPDNAYYLNSPNKTFDVAYGNQYDRPTALSKCKTDTVYCTALLILDNWEFKDDYPYNI